MDYATTHNTLDRILASMTMNQNNNKNKMANKTKPIPKISSPSLGRYQNLATDEAASGDISPINTGRRDQRWLKLYAFALTISTLILGVQALYTWFKPATICMPPVIEQGYKTEWGPARTTIEHEQVVFTSSFKYNETGKTYYRDFDPSQPQYVGKPAPEIDKAWEELLLGQYLVVSEEEAMQMDDPVDIRGIYLAEVEVMHSLHCVNAIRKALSPEYYSIHDMHQLPKELRHVHVEHCLDQLRQAIQCGGDLTPVPLRPFGEAPNINLVGTPQSHTCRKWGTFRDWWTERGQTYGKLNSQGT